MNYSRRNILLAGGAIAGSTLLGPLADKLSAEPNAPAPVPARPIARDDAPAAPSTPSARAPDGIRPALFAAALAALERHGPAVKRDRMAIVDFAAASSQPRFHLVDLAGGRNLPLLVSHGSGSDPDHCGWVERFSNQPGSNASCEGAFLTGDYYVGKHGRSQRLTGLDPTNSNALARAIVVHGAWYAEPDMIRGHGKLGRSQGCFAVGDSRIQQLFDHLGEGRMIYAAKLA
ncbi:murein L,D-transpeptidase catalytic domain family protein [Edaphosphingomonas haloaromaticamans]|uniref:L,D-transpeptidase catalytic domain n=1 Tax=Edaphosphingomonas haloaromaticamans TaxID=653954 RepID=A0A1S1H906_9SPHN|nr:murein L,D-transpeptidase catalytic domain family protein [Sphingomonas haloaromaticamans]OHT18598.1 hypothetical protein BHE75_00572 [Sphingomonas haloaromaticamans]